MLLHGKPRPGRDGEVFVIRIGVRRPSVPGYAVEQADREPARD
ncbi:hypothetical protein [Streptomyces sp. A1277]|nr:hypothetical protein [Streptomyces sp. A1277]